MREILFRGKRVNSGDWVQGDLRQVDAEAYILDYDISDDGISQERRLFDIAYHVDPATIGQFTGLIDKKGKRVFEGDIIKLVTADYEEITITCEFGPVRRQIFENEVEITGFYFVRSNDGRKTFPITRNYLGKHDTEIWEVIGNIHDNPDLLP